ncbi:hypothetical protein Bbelb_321180 [Branchiostoma belcheri]|nr:hypothetical protein Bbelb_321180 [Branchiostoma belcheri]
MENPRRVSHAGIKQQKHQQQPVRGGNQTHVEHQTSVPNPKRDVPGYAEVVTQNESSTDVVDDRPVTCNVGGSSSSAEHSIYVNETSTDDVLEDEAEVPKPPPRSTSIHGRAARHHAAQGTQDKLIKDEPLKHRPTDKPAVVQTHSVVQTGLPEDQAAGKCKKTALCVSGIVACIVITTIVTTEMSMSYPKGLDGFLLKARGHLGGWNLSMYGFDSIASEQRLMHMLSRINKPNHTDEQRFYRSNHTDQQQRLYRSSHTDEEWFSMINHTDEEQLFTTIRTNVQRLYTPTRSNEKRLSNPTHANQIRLFTPIRDKEQRHSTTTQAVNNWVTTFQTTALPAKSTKDSGYKRLSTTRVAPKRPDHDLTTSASTVPPTHTDPPETYSCQVGDGTTYRGTVSVTKRGKTCQRWDSQTPHGHTRTAANHPASGLEQNYCRNPDGESGVWCYTTDPNTTWDYCDVPLCDDSGDKTSLATTSLATTSLATTHHESTTTFASTPLRTTHVEDGDTETAFSCEHGILHLSCSDGKTLFIVDATFGRTTNSYHHCHCSVCRTDCRSDVSLDVVRAACQGKHHCSVLASNDVFGDPCPLVQKYLVISYRCITGTGPKIGGMSGLELGTSWFQVEHSAATPHNRTGTAACHEPLGMESGAIPDGSITASSSYYGEPYRARLNGVAGEGAWSAAFFRRKDQWLQVDLGEAKRVSGTVIQGRHKDDRIQYVKSYKLQYSADGKGWVTYAGKDGSEKVFPGNSDKNTPVTNLLDTPVVARYVRFWPRSCVGWRSMRVEILGCSEERKTCALRPCLHGSCVDGTKTYTCTCHPGYEGRNCDKRKTRYERRGDTQYKVYPKPKTYQDAQRACAADGGHLVDVKTPALQRFIVEMVLDVNKYRDYWIGLQLQKKRNWKWTDGTDIRDCDYNNWAPREPDPKHPTDCAQLSSSHGFRWKDDGCEQKEYFICQKGGEDDCYTGSGNAYRGTSDVTASGRKCQRWVMPVPHLPKFWPPNVMLQKNYCRKPDKLKDPGGPWCYTMDRGQRWEFCGLPVCG